MLRKYESDFYYKLVLTKTSALKVYIFKCVTINTSQMMFFRQVQASTLNILMGEYL